jgi:hypothetical protein
MRLNDWKTMPIFSLRMRASSRSPRRVMSRPSMTMRPPLGESIPARMPSRVDLPEPDGPVSATHSPRPIWNDTPLRMGICSPAIGSERVISMASAAQVRATFIRLGCMFDTPCDAFLLSGAS